MKFDADHSPSDGSSLAKLPSEILPDNPLESSPESKMPMDWLAKGKRPVRPEGKTNFEYPHELKVEVVLEVLKGNIRQSEIAERYGVPQPLISLWRKTAIEGMVKSLDGKRRGRPPTVRGFAIPRNGGDLSEAEELVLRVGSALRENTKLLESTLQLILGRQTPTSEGSDERDPA